MSNIDTEQDASGTKGRNIPIFPVAIVLTLGLLFFKLAGLADISWWWIFSPLWVAAGATVALGLLGVGMLVLAAAFNKKEGG